MGSELVDVLRHLLGSTPSDELAEPTIDAWWTQHLAAVEPFTSTMARAFVSGFEADRVGFAFASGYTEALGSLVPVLTGIRSALCVTEAGGHRPRELSSTLTENEDGSFRLDGEKTFVTLGGDVEELLVVAAAGLDDHDRPRLRMARIPRKRDGLQLEVLPELAFCPEIPHAKIELKGVLVTPDEMLVGDAYDEYVKPFRTTEDLHVLAAIVGFLMRIARRTGWSKAHREALAAFVAAIYPLGLAEPLDAGVHVSLGGVFRRLELLIDQLDWSAVDSTTRARFERDRPILRVASAARDQRLKIAWRRLGQPE